MLKTISAALLAVSVLAAPALAGPVRSGSPAPISKSHVLVTQMHGHGQHGPSHLRVKVKRHNHVHARHHMGHKPSVHGRYVHNYR